MTEVCTYGLWNGLDELNHDINLKIKKICVVQDIVFVLAINLELYYGFAIDKKNIQFLKYCERSITDIGSQGTYLYFVDSDGKVFRTKDISSREFHEIILEEESKSCVHGYQSHGSTMKVKNIAVGDYGVLFITDRYELWASGTMPEIRIESESPQKVLFFGEKIITDIAVGKDFAMVLSRKSLRYDRESDSEISENVFVNNCPQCVLSSRMSSPASNDTCPLGLKIDKFSEECISPNNGSPTESNPLLDSKLEGLEDVMDDFNSTDILNESRSVEEPDKARTLHSFINSDSARLFLTKQLSWMSAGEEYLADYTEKPTRIIKENVSNLTSLVYEGVKSLSRHMSGGSENGTADIANRSDNNNEDAVSRLYDFFESCSTFSDRDNSENDSSEKASCLIKTGQRLLNSDLWTWGKVNHGQLGTGDQIKRSRPVLVTKLSGLGIKNISCGDEHALALSLDGRIFLWGENNYHQLSSDSKMNQSFPKQFDKLANERILAAYCGARHTSILTHNLRLCFMGKHLEGVTEGIVELNSCADEQHDDSGIGLKKISHPSKSNGKIKLYLNVSNVHAFGTYTYCNAVPKVPEYVALEQKFLEDLLLIQIYLLKPLCKTLSSTLNDLEAYESLCSRFSDVLYLTALNVESLHLFIENNIDVFEVILVHKIDEMIFVYNEYLKALCNVISLNGFRVLSKKFEIPPYLKRFYTYNKKLKTTEDAFGYIFNYPTERALTYKNMTASLFNNMEFQDKLSIEKQVLDLEMKWELFNTNKTKCTEDAQVTRNFWSGAGKTLETFWLPERRLIRDSKINPLWVHNTYRFINHWFILLTDILLHIINGHPNVYDLKTLWIEPLPDTDLIRNSLVLITPEDNITVYAASPSDKSEWLLALQQAVKGALKKCISNQPPVIRSADYTYTKHTLYKDAKYSGRWVKAVMSGAGKLKWADGKTYVGQFQNNQMHGFGIMDYPNIGTYEGHWKDGQQCGNGIFRYINGDLYKGQFLSGKLHGHGVLKRGHFNSSVASIYVGNFMFGIRSGYGVLDDVANGQKYLGSWADDKKNGFGLLVTLDGNYYEGVFTQDLLTGNGTVIFEDGSHYEGELKGLNGPGGKGALYIGNRVLEGHLGGTWDNIKITGTLQCIGNSSDEDVNTSTSKLSLESSRKWDCIFQQYYTQLGFPYKDDAQGRTKNKIWQSISIFMVNSRMENAMKNKSERMDRRTKYDELETIPSFGMNKLDLEELEEIKAYLIKAFDCPVHPLHYLLNTLANAYTFAYGGVIVSPLLKKHALLELREITQGIYEVITAMFPALPRQAKWLQNKVLVSPSSILHPLILPRLHSALFVLYALANRENDESYWRRLCMWHVQDNVELMNSLGVDSDFREVVCSESFLEAVECLQQIKTTFCAHHKILVLRNTFKLLRDSVHRYLGADFLMGMDSLFPLFLILVIRARLLQLGSEVSIIEDLLEQSGINEATQQEATNSPQKDKTDIDFFVKNFECDLSQHLGENDVMITTLKACYHQILQEKIHSQ